MKEKKQFIIFGLLLLLILTIIILLARPLAIVLFISALFSVFLKPLVEILSRRMPHAYAVTGSVVGFLSFSILGITLIAGTLLPAITKFIQDIPYITQSVIAFPGILANNYPWLGSPEFVQNQLKEIMQSASVFVMDFAKTSAIPLLKTASHIAELIGVPIITFYLIKDGSLARKNIAGLFPVASPQIETFLGKSVYVLGKYVRGQAAVSLFSGIMVLLFGLLFNVPHAIVFAFLSAVGEWIPVVGPIVAATLAISTGFLQDTSLALKMLIFYTILFKISHNIVYPALVGKATKLHPAVIMIGVLFAGHIGGTFGMLIVVPAIAILYIYFAVLLG